MAAVRDIHQKQHAVIEFLVSEYKMVGNIHKRLQKVYGEDTIDHSTVCCWAQRTSGKGEHANISDLPCSGWPQSAQMDATERMKNMIMANRCITVKQLPLWLAIGEESVCRILEQL
jgi:hypothetical protein